MEDLLLQGGNTPFERAAAGRAQAHKQITIMYATDQLVKLLDECNVMLNMWREEIAAGGASDETQMLAAEALKDKRAAEAALDELLKSAEALGLGE